MNAFFRDRGPRLAAVVLIMFVISLTQTGISYTMTFGALRDFLPKDRTLVASLLVVVRFGVVGVLAILWILKRERALFWSIIVANGLFTLALFIHASALFAVLFGAASEAVSALLLDVLLMAASNVLIFSIWYWIVDPPGVEATPRADEAWDLLFPQRASALPHYEGWTPRYVDYLFVAFTTSFAFSPTDTLPLTRRAKMLMLVQATFSVVTLTGIAGSAINIFAGGK
jgi:hypothetical protein